MVWDMDGWADQAAFLLPLESAFGTTLPCSRHLVLYYTFTFTVRIGKPLRRLRSKRQAEARKKAYSEFNPVR